MADGTVLTPAVLRDHWQSVLWTCIGCAIWVLPVMLAVGLKQGGGQ